VDQVDNDRLRGAAGAHRRHARTIIASRSEYDASLDALASRALGGAVRHLIATRSVVFVGYSLRDDDIRDVIDVLRADLGTAAPRCYFVHPSKQFISPIEGAEVLHTWQYARGKSLIEPHGGVIVVEFFDIDKSRSIPPQRRPEAGKLLAALADPNRGFEAVVVGEP
jgi:hypothetical protein